MASAEQVNAIAAHVFFTDEEAANGTPEGAVTVEGIVCKYAFNAERLQEKRAEIIAQLETMPDEFFTNKGGGMSFLNACVDRDGNHWAEHPTMGMLFALGEAVGVVRSTMPRDMWERLPGSVPYFTITLP